MRRRGGAALCVALAATAAAVGPSNASAVAGPCVGENAVVTAETIPQAERSLLCLVNTYRLERGLRPLAHDPALNRAARAHCQDIVTRRYFSHTNPEGLGPGERAVAAGYPSSLVAENLAVHSTETVRALFDLWRSDPPHDRAMLNPDDRNAGMGLALGNDVDGPSGDGLCGVQDFGAARTGATDTALDLSPVGCAVARASKEAAKSAVAKQRRRVRRADDGGERRRAIRKLRRLRAKLDDARAAVASACG